MNKNWIFNTKITHKNECDVIMWWLHIKKTHESNIMLFYIVIHIYENKLKNI